MRIIDRSQKQLQANLLDRLILVISPSWAYRRRQARAALAEVQEAEEPQERAQVSDGGGWTSIDDPENPLNPGNLRASRERHRGWS